MIKVPLNVFKLEKSFHNYIDAFKIELRFILFNVAIYIFC